MLLYHCKSCLKDLVLLPQRRQIKKTAHPYPPTSCHQLSTNPIGPCSCYNLTTRRQPDQHEGSAMSHKKAPSSSRVQHPQLIFLCPAMTKQRQQRAAMVAGGGCLCGPRTSSQHQCRCPAAGSLLRGAATSSGLPTSHITRAAEGCTRTCCTSAQRP